MKKADCQSYNWPLQKKLSHELRQPCHPASHGSWQEPLATKSWQIWKKHSLQPQCIVWISSVNLPRTHFPILQRSTFFKTLLFTSPSYTLPEEGLQQRWAPTPRTCSQDIQRMWRHQRTLQGRRFTRQVECWRVAWLPLGRGWHRSEGLRGTRPLYREEALGKSNDNVEVSIPGTETFFHFQSSRFTNSLMKYGYLKVLIFGKHSIKKDIKNRCEWTSWTEWSLCLA